MWFVNGHFSPLLPWWAHIHKYRVAGGAATLTTNLPRTPDQPELSGQNEVVTPEPGWGLIRGLLELPVAAKVDCAWEIVWLQTRCPHCQWWTHFISSPFFKALFSEFLCILLSSECLPLNVVLTHTYQGVCPLVDVKATVRRPAVPQPTSQIAGHLLFQQDTKS